MLLAGFGSEGIKVEPTAAAAPAAAPPPPPTGRAPPPPMAPATWHAWHIAGEYAAISMLAAVNFRDLSGEGQFVDVSVHEAVNTCTEIAIPTYIYSGQVVLRQTARH